MEITTKNYSSIIKKIGGNLPETLEMSHAYILSKTSMGKNWSLYNKDKEFTRLADLIFKKLEEFINANPEKTMIKNPYSGISNECRFIERFLAFHNKLVYKRSLGAFIDDLQKAMDEKKIRKTSPVAKEIMAMQKAAVNQFNEMYNSDHFALKPETIKRFKYIIERYNSLENLDQKFAKSEKKTTGLHGIEQVEVPIQQPEQDQQPAIMPSEEFASRQFQTVGLKGKWLKLIGDPSPGFKAMVFGMPKMGKSYLCVDFASYLSKNHGKVLYITKEEFLSPTFLLKIKEKNAANANLDIAGAVPADLSAYQFVFLDSVTSLKLTPDDLKALEQKYPGISFIYVFQVTKAGSARGTNEFMHNVDVVIEIPQRGKAVQFGRFNQGGEMAIFSDEINSEDSLALGDNVSTLAGIKKKDMKKPKEKSERTDTGASAQELYNQTIAQLDSFRTMAHNLSTTKSPGWDTVAELAKIHTWLANNQDDVDYSEHKKSFQTVAQGIKRNFQGIIKLLEGFSESTKDDMISNNTYSLKEWSKTYAEGLELFKYLRPSEAKDGEQTESPKMLGDDIGKLIKQIKKNAYDIMLNRFFPDHKERHTIALELTNLYRWLATNIIGAYDFLPNQETETAISTRYKACLDLLDQLSFDIKNHVAKKNMGELTEWKDVLSDGVKNMEAIVLAAIHRTKLKEKSSPSDTPKSERLSEWTISKHPNTGDKEIDYSDVLHELKILHEENVGKKFTDDQFNEIFAIALKRNEQLYEISIELRDNVLEFLMALDKATDEWKRIKSGVFNQGGQNEDLPEDKSELFGVKKKAR